SRSRSCSVRGTRGVHTRSPSDHGIGGAVETGNKQLPHVPRRVYNNSSGCCKPERLGSDGRRGVCGVRQQGDGLGFFGREGFGQKPGSGSVKDDGRLKMGWLHASFYPCTDTADGDETKLI
ncbi:hypothetical protein LINGRAPRIM_LOCUS2310, partial [Linum grandiflorum]